jgi:two-component system cell cycle sensor histidine kinase/response regulator CckA
MVTVLIAEDDVGLRYAISKMLTFAGYRVMLAANGREALETAENYVGVIHLLCTDIEMPPGIDGFELGLRLTAQRPDTKVLHLTGGETKTTSALRKPFTDEQLIAKVREVLTVSQRR